MDEPMHKGALKPLYHRARELRNNSTLSEIILWGYLKTKPYGVKFRRQHPYSIYILDFYAHSLKLVIEVDGGIHNDTAVKLKDEQRQQLIEKDGLTVMRFSNEQVEIRLEEVQQSIENYIIKCKDEK